MREVPHPDSIKRPLGRDLGEDELVALARESERVRAQLDDGEAARTVVVPGKLVNFVI